MDSTSAHLSFKTVGYSDVIASCYEIHFPLAALDELNIQMGKNRNQMVK